MILVLVLYAVFAGMVFVHSALMQANPYPFFVATFRALASSGFMLSLYVYHIRSQKKPWNVFMQLSAGSWMRATLQGVLLYCGALGGFAWAMQYLDGIAACFILSTGPFLTAVILYFQGKEIITWRKLLGMLVGACALIPIILAQSHGSGEASSITEAQKTFGSLLFFAATFCYSYGWIIAKRLTQDLHEVPQSFTTAYAMFVGTICSFLINIFVLGNSLVPAQPSENFWPVLLFFTGLTIICYGLYSYLLNLYSATFLSFASFLEPALALLYGIVFMGVSMTFSSLVALCGLTVGLYIFYQEELRLA